MIVRQIIESGGAGNRSAGPAAGPRGGLSQAVSAKRVAATLLVLFTVAAATGDDRRPLREARSKSGRFVLTIEPASGREGEARCRATLAERTRGEGETRMSTRWTQELVHETGPGRAFVHDDGAYVVTLDEHGVGGARHAIVVYDGQGRLIRDLGLRDVLRRGDWRHVKRRGKSVEWLAGAKFAFANQPDRFVIDLRWRRKVEILLENGTVLDDAGENAQDSVGADGADILPELLALLDPASGGRAGEPPTAASRAESDEARIVEEIISQILGEMDESGIDAPDDFSEQSLEQELQSAELSGQLDAAFLAPEELGGIVAEAIARSGEVAQALDGTAAQQPPPSAAGNSAQAGWPVPMPNPADPVDYVGWLNQQVRVEGGAAPLYREAFDGIVQWEGDDELMDKANRGDADALVSPQIAAWLEANDGVLQRVMAANALDYRGMPVDGPDGSMLGILLPHAGEMRQVGRMLTMKGRMLEQAGDVNGAMEYYLQGVRLGAQASNGPTLIENLVGQAIQTQSSETLLDSLAKDNPAVDYAALAQRIEADYRAARPVAEPFQMERTFVLDTIQQAYEFDAETGAYRVSESGVGKVHAALGLTASNAGAIDEASLGLYLAATGFEALVHRTNDYYDQITNAARAPFAEGRERFAQIEQTLGSAEFRATDPLLSQLLPAVSRAAELSTRSEAQRRATLLATNLKAYRHQHGSYPESLDALGAGEFLADPFSGDRFAYRRVGDDFVLYSVGSNLSDEGGVHDPRKATNDIVYWPRPPKQP